MSATKPCDTCPYKRSTPVGVWDFSEYINLLRHDGDPMGGAAFQCHLKDGSMCRGWLADQKRRNVPSIPLRMQLMTNNELCTTFNAIDENDPDLYSSIEEMCEANEGAAFPAKNKKARKLKKMKERR